MAFLSVIPVKSSDTSLLNSALLFYYYYFFSEVIRLLLQYGAAVNQTDKAHYKTGLHVACEAQSVACVQYLLDAGADPNVQAEQGCTPLHIGILLYLWEWGREGAYSPVTHLY